MPISRPEDVLVRNKDISEKIIRCIEHVLGNDELCAKALDEQEKRFKVPITVTLRRPVHPDERKFISQAYLRKGWKEVLWCRHGGIFYICLYY